MSLNILILKDRDIKDTSNLRRELAEFYFENGGVELQFWEEEFDYSEMEVSITVSQFNTLSEGFMKETCEDVYRRYMELIDHVVFLIHEDKYRLFPMAKLPNGRNIWGENFSNYFSGYQVEISRWDKDNPANSFGTFYHEMHHAHDAFVYKYTGVDVAKLLGISKWDLITHGELPQWDYITYNENKSSIKFIGPYLEEASRARRKVWEAKKLGFLKQILILTQRLLQLVREYRKTK